MIKDQLDLSSGHLGVGIDDSQKGARNELGEFQASKCVYNRIIGHNTEKSGDWI